MIDVSKIVDLQSLNIIEWHNKLIEKEVEFPWKFIEENNKWNFCLWHEEDIARVVNIDLEKIVAAKRKIDKFNQERNNAMEKIDEWVLSQVKYSANLKDLPLHSETPGMMIDRLSILGLKKYHMDEQAYRKDVDDKHKAMCYNKSKILYEQIFDLSTCLENVLFKIEQNQLQFKVYRQLKMYNDPNLNPELYKKGYEK